MLPHSTFGAQIPFVSLLGFELLLFEGGRSEIAFDVQPEHCNSFAVAHGGALMTLLDVCMAVAARSMDKEMGAITIEMKTSFMRPATGRVVGHGSMLHRTGSMAFMQATVTNAAGESCAHATGTFKLIRRRAPDADAGPGQPPHPVSTD